MSQKRLNMDKVKAAFLEKHGKKWDDVKQCKKFGVHKQYFYIWDKKIPKSIVNALELQKLTGKKLEDLLEDVK